MYTTALPDFSNRNYIYVDHDEQIMGFTTDSHLASSPKQISKFYSRYSNTLPQHLHQHLACAKLERPTIEKIEKSNLPLFFKKIFKRIVSIVASIFSFIKNGGKTDGRLAKDVGNQAAKQYVSGFYRVISHENQRSLRNLMSYEEVKNKIEKSKNEIDETSTDLNDVRELDRLHRQLKNCEDTINKIKNNLQFEKEELRLALTVLEPKDTSIYLEEALQEFKTTNEKLILCIKTLLECTGTEHTPSANEEDKPATKSLDAFSQMSIETPSTENKIETQSQPANSITEVEKQDTVSDEANPEIFNIPEDASVEDLKALIARHPEKSDSIISTALDNQSRRFDSPKSDQMDTYAIGALGKAQNLFSNLAKLVHHIDFEEDCFRFLNTLEEQLISTKNIKKNYENERNTLIDDVLKFLSPIKITNTNMELLVRFLKSYQIENSKDPYTEFLRKVYSNF